MPTTVEPFTGAPRGASGLAASPDGERLLVYGGQEALLLSAPELRPVARIQLDPGPVWAAGWSADGRRLALSTPGGVVVLDAVSGQRVASLPELSGPAALSPDGARVAAAGRGDRLMVTSVQDGPRALSALGASAGRRGTASPEAWCGDGARLAVSCTGHGPGGVSHEVTIWEPGPSRRLACFAGERTPLWDPRGRLLTVAPGEGALRVREGSLGEAGLAELRSEPLGVEPGELSRARLSWSPDGEWLLAWRLRGRGGLRVLRPGSKPGPPSPRLGALADATPCGPDRVALLRAADRGVELRDAWTWEKLSELAAATELRHVSMGPDGTWALIAYDGDPQGLILWSLEGDGLLARWPGAGPPLALSPDGGMLAFAAEEDAVALWDVRRRRSGGTLRGHDGRVWELDWAPDGQLLASAGADQQVLTWSLDQEEPLHVLAADTELAATGAPSLCFSPERGLLAVQAQDDELEPPAVLDPASGDLLALPEGAGALVAWLDDERLLCLHPEEPGILECWRWEDGAVVDACEVGGDGALSVEVSAGRVLFSTADGDLGLWEPEGGPTWTLDFDEPPVSWNLWRSGALAVLGRRGSLRVWNGTGEDPLFTLEGVAAFAPHPLDRSLWVAREGELVRVGASGEVARRWAGPEGHRPAGVSVSGDGRRACTWDRRSVQLWGPEGAEQQLFVTAEGLLVEAEQVSGPAVRVSRQGAWSWLELV